MDEAEGMNTAIQYYAKISILCYIKLCHTLHINHRLETVYHNIWEKRGPTSRLGHNVEPSDLDSKIDEGFEKEMADEVIIDEDIDPIDLPATSRARE